MALVGWEWIVIGVVAIVIILWGPAKIPEFAKALGKVKGEFNKASKEFNEAASTPPTNSGPTANFSEVKPSAAIKSKDEMLLETAKSLGIPTEGKTRDELTQEISLKVKQLGAG